MGRRGFTVVEMLIVLAIIAILAALAAIIVSEPVERRDARKAQEQPQEEQPNELIVSGDQSGGNTWGLRVYTVTDSKTGKRYMIAKGSATDAGVAVIELGAVTAESGKE